MAVGEDALAEFLLGWVHHILPSAVMAAVRRVAPDVPLGQLVKEAAQRGLFASDGKEFYVTQAGHAWLESKLAQ